MIRSNFFCVMFFVLLFTVNNSVLAYNDSVKKLSSQSPDDFYQNYVDKEKYEEFIDSDIKVRKLILVKDLPKVYDEKEWKNYPSSWKKHLKKAVIGNTKDLNPEQQVYYYFSLKDHGEKIHIKFALYDPQNEKIHSHGGGHWTKDEFKRKFKQDKTTSNDDPKSI